LAKYSSEAQTITTVSDWQKVLRSFLINLVLFSVLNIAIIYLSSNYVLPMVREHLDDNLGPVAASALTLLVMAPFLWGLTVRNEQNESFARIYAQQKYKGPIWLMRGFKIGLALFFIIFLLNRFFSFAIALYAAVLMATLFSILRHNIQRLYDKLENRFISNLNDRELQAELKAMELQADKRNIALAPWDAHMTTFEILPETSTSVLGKTLEELRWRELIGINIAMIKRGQITIVSPQRHDRIFPGDKLYIICTDAQEKKMNAILRADKKLLEEQKEVEVQLDKFTIEHDSPFINKSISESGIRTSTHGLVVGIERSGRRILNPESTTMFEEGDVVWIVGEKKLIEIIG
jgi:CPA2 family monovalent cation:H+ antiporter-2